MPATEVTPDDPNFCYDEFAYFDENCHEYGISRPGDLAVARVAHTLDDGRTISGLRWGSGRPTAVFLHGGAQNAHTWDTVLLALNIDALALDLPGHGHSSPRDDGWYDPANNAAAVIATIEAFELSDVLLVGMSLGGLTATAIAARRPDLVRSLVVVDVTPGVNADKAEAVHAFIAGPQYFETFDEIFGRTVHFNPTRTHESLRRGILHNAHRVTEGEHAGRWRWNYDRRKLSTEDMPPMVDLWSDVAAVKAPYLLVRGGASPVVDDDDVAELMRHQPTAEVIVVDGAGHSVQGDDPLRLTEILRNRL
ncbi:MAG: alpha/beta hydrolase [Actinobacteria bacterium]|nr:alpha/beta hydrolase [Actinomycetota bacterium]